MPTMSSAWPVKVVPSTAATPIVFSSIMRLHVLGPDRVLAFLQRHDPRLDVEVAAELLPDHVHVAAEDQVRLVDRLAGRFAPLLPLPLQREGAEHDRLRGALGAGAGGLAGRVVEVGEHADAALLDLGRDRVLGVVDEVAVEVLGDQPLRLGLHPGGDEGGEVALRVALQRQFLVDQAHRVERGHAAGREGAVGGVFGEEAVAVEHRGLVGAEWLGHAFLTLVVDRGAGRRNPSLYARAGALGCANRRVCATGKDPA